MLAAWVLSRTIMDVLGHSAIGVTMNTYAHVVMQLRKDAADAIDGALGERCEALWQQVRQHCCLRRGRCDSLSWARSEGLDPPNLLIRGDLRAGPPPGHASVDLPKC